MATTSSVAPSRPIGFQSWHDLLFLHWHVPSEQLVSLLPRGLTLDTWQGQAWVGLIAFRMSGIRPWWSPAIWRLSAFPETNVRTYVRHGDDEPGVWFLSLDAARLAAVLIGRARWHLNYHWAQMQVRREPGHAKYESRRFGRRAAQARIEAAIDEPGAASIAAIPGTLDHFLIERYVFYNQASDGRLFRGSVRHAPYRLHSARVVSLEESLLAAGGLDVSGPPDHVVFSPGVDVEIESLRRV